MRSSGGGLWVGKGYGSEPAFRRDPVHNLSHGATAFQVARLYTMLAEGTLFTPRFNALMMDILSKPGIHHKFVRALEGVPGVRIFRKSGTWKNYHADSALVEQDGRRFVMVAIAEDADGGDLARAAGPAHAPDRDEQRPADRRRLISAVRRSRRAGAWRAFGARRRSSCARCS